VAGLLLLPPVQTFLAQQAVGYLKTEFNIDASIGRLAIKLPNSIALEDVYIADDHADTLIYAQDLSLTYNGFDQLTNTLKSSGVTLRNGRLYMRKYPEDSLFNFGYFLEKLSSDSTTDTTAEPFRLKIGYIDITEFRFTKHRLGCTDTCTNIFLKETEIQMANMFLDGDYVSGDILHMSYLDEGRFRLHDFRGKAAYQPKYISVHDLYFKTDSSMVEGDVVLNYESPDRLGDFLDVVDIEGSFQKSTLSSNEFRHYIEEFPQFGIFTITGNFSGPVNDFKVDDCIITMGEQTRFFGRVHIMHPSESELLKIDAKAGELRTTPTELRRYLTQFTGEMDWMTMLDQFGSIAYKGEYKGSIKDFDIKGTLALDENVLTVDGSMHDFDQLEKTRYEGFVEAQPINLGKLLAQPELGMAHFTAEVMGSGLTASSLNADIKGWAEYIDALGYRYHNLQIDGHVSKGSFVGISSLRDANLKYDFDGNLDFTRDTITTDFCLAIENANLHALGFMPDTVSMLNLETDVAFKWFADEWWDGNILVTDITYESPMDFFFFDSLRVTSLHENKKHTDILTSKIANMRLEGSYGWGDVFSAFKSEYEGFNRLAEAKSVRPDIAFAYNLQLNNIDIITDLFLPELYVEPGTEIKGAYAATSPGFNLEVNSILIKWNKIGFNDVQFSAKRDSAYFINTEVSTLNFAGGSVDSVKLKVGLDEDSAWFATSGIFRDSIDSYFRLQGNVYDSTSEAGKSFVMSLKQGRFNIGNNLFSLIPKNRIVFKTDEVIFENVGFYDKKSAIVANGFWANDPFKILRISTHNLSADILNYTIRYPGIAIEGRIGGDIIINREEGIPKFAGDLGIDSLIVNDEFLGDLDIRTYWNIKSGLVTAEGEIMRGTRKMLALDGTFQPDSNRLRSMNLTFDRFRLMWLDPLLVGVLDNIRGTVTGTVQLSGELKNLTSTGELKLVQGGLGVPYFNTDYTLDPETTLKITTGKIEVLRTTITDSYKNTSGKFFGSVTHTNFDDWTFDLHLSADNILVLNTENSIEADFYGLGYAGGTFDITGPIDDMNITVDITTRKGTAFKIPFSNPVNVGSQDFITYTGRGGYDYIEIDVDAITESKVNIGGLDVVVNAKITDDALVQLVMDETVGDIISGRGSGDLRILIPHNGDMEMYGTVVISEGDYLFTMRNLINKKFKIVPGGTIKWTGSPYDAVVDMKAKYTTRTTLTGFVTNNYDGQRVQVDLIMDLKGIVTNPNINFQILLPNSNPSYQDELNNRLNDPDKLNEQAFSLLVINSFWSQSVNAGTDNSFINQGVSSNTAQMLAAQFTNFIAQGLGDYVDISVGYNTATNNPSNPESSQLSDELEVGLSKNLFNDRITVNSKIDVPVGTSTNNSSQNFTGDIEVVYKITRDGRIRAKAFNRSNQDNPTLDALAPYTQGVGIFYQTTFNSWSQFYHKIFGTKPKEEHTPEQPEAGS
jgi:hypothetical protein